MLEIMITQSMMMEIPVTVNEIAEKLYELQFVQKYNFQIVSLNIARDIVEMHENEMMTDRDLDEVIAGEVNQAIDKLFWEIEQALPNLPPEIKALRTAYDPSFTGPVDRGGSHT